MCKSLPVSTRYALTDSVTHGCPMLASGDPTQRPMCAAAPLKIKPANREGMPTDSSVPGTHREVRTDWQPVCEATRLGMCSLAYLQTESASCSPAQHRRLLR